MKKIFIPFVIAATTLSFAACQKEVSSPAIEDELVSLNFSSANPTTKTVADAVNKTILWEKGDKISVAYTVNDIWQNATGDATADKPAKIYVSNGLDTGGETAVFNISASFKATTAGAHQFYSVYPSSCVKSNNNDIKYAPSITMTVPNVQTPAENSFDAAADLMIGKATKTYNSLSEAKDDAIPLLWQRIVSHADITLKGLQGLTENEVITTIVLTADADAKLVGDRWIDIQNGNILGPKTITDANILTINGTNLKVNNNNVEFWAAVMPATVKSLKIAVETNKATYTRNIESCNIEFKQNARKGLNVDMSSVERVEKSVGLALPFDEDFNAVIFPKDWDNIDIKNFPNFSNFSLVRGYKIDGAIIIGSSSTKGSVSTADINLSKASHVIIRAKKYDNVAISMTAGGKTYTTAKLGENFQDYSINLPALSSTEKITITSDIKGRLYIDRIQIIEGNFAELSINPEYQSVKSSATSTTFSVSSNTKWTVSTTSDWAKVSTPSSENNGEVEITFSENTADKKRTADIVVKTKDCSITKTFKLTQNGVGGAESTLVWDDDFSSLTKATTALKSLNGSKTGFKDAYTIDNCYPEVSSIKMSSGKTIGSLQTPKFTKLSGSSSVVVTVEYAGYGTTEKSDGGTLNLSVVGNGTLSVKSLTATNTATNGADVKTWDKATFVISGADKSTALKLTASAKGKRFFINSIKIEIN